MYGQKKKFSPKSVLGQHFLTDKNILRRIAEAAGVSDSDAVLEIGPGTGTLTAVLSERAKRVVTVEKDPRLSALLRDKFANQKNVAVVCGDILKLNPMPHALRPIRYKIVANIPYYITGRLLRLMIEPGAPSNVARQAWPRPTGASLMLQKEVAIRITAKPPQMNRLAAILQCFARPKIIATVRRGSFTPSPDVDSAILAIENIQRESPNDIALIKLIATGFSQPRKRLASNLLKVDNKVNILSALNTLGLSPEIRPAKLSCKEWRDLSTALHSQLQKNKV